MKMKKMNPKFLKYLKRAGIVLAVLFILYAFFYWLPLSLPSLRGNFPSDSEDNSMSIFGQMGDSYGIFNALFSGLAFFGVIATLYIQSRDNKKRTVAEQFYQMLDVQQKVIDEIHVSQVRKARPGETISSAKGRKAFLEFKIQIKNLVQAVKDVSQKMVLDSRTQKLLTLLMLYSFMVLQKHGNHL